MYIYLYIILLIITTTKGSTYSISINISPEVIQLNATVTVTCKATANDNDNDNDNDISTLMPYNIINGTYLPYTCVASYESSERFSGLQYYFTYLPDVMTFTTEVSISPITPLDDGLTLACVFYDVRTQTYDTSRTLSVSIVYSTATSTAEVQTTTNLLTTPQGISGNFVNSRDFYITVGTFSAVVFGSLILIFCLFVIIIVCTCKRVQAATHPPLVDWNRYDRYPVYSTEV